MLFQSQQTRMALFGFVFSLAVDLAFAYLLIRYFGSPRDLGTLLITFAIIQAITLVFLIRSGVANWLAFALWGRGGAATKVAAELRAQGFERREGFFSNARAYFSDIAEDPDMPIEMRLRSAVIVGELIYPASAGHWMEGVRVAMVFEKAVQLL